MGGELCALMGGHTYGAEHLVELCHSGIILCQTGIVDGREEVVVLSGGAFHFRAIDVHEGHIDRQSFDRAERQTYRRFYFGGTGCLGVVVVIVAGGGVEHQPGAQVEAVGEIVLCPKVVGECVVVVLFKMLVEGGGVRRS